jgi:RNA polymerase sigma-70 factor, ECF subfamily
LSQDLIHSLIYRVIRDDDQRAFAELVRLHQSNVRTTLRKLTRGNDSLADDLAQETFVLAWRKIKLFRFEAQFSTWLYRIAFNVYASYQRKSSEVLINDMVDSDHGDAFAETLLSEQDADHSTATTAEAVQASVDIQRAMTVLNDAERAAIVACYHNDLSHEEASAALAMPLGTLKTHILKAKQKLKLALGEYAQI